MRLFLKPAYLTIGAFLLLLGGCSSETEEPAIGDTWTPNLMSYVEATLGDAVEAEALPTRATLSSTDYWTVANFGPGDKVGMYALAGRQNPEDPDDYSLPMFNQEMFFEGKSGSNYRFGNSEVVMDPQTLHGKYSKMFYPYYADMPSTTDSRKLPGITLRQLDPRDGIYKCLDFMYTGDSYIPVTEGVLKPSFYHAYSALTIVRKEGFDDPKDDRIWIVTKSPYTDVRVYQSSYSPTGSFTYTTQYNPPEGEELMTRDLPDLKFDVNKYSIWECWNGATKGYKYCLIPPVAVYFIYIQDNFGNWQNVSDFYLGSTGSKTPSSNTKYTINVSLKGVDVVVRPVSVVKWDEEVVITDDRKVGIGDYQEYQAWAASYNAYVQNERSPAYVDALLNYGDAVLNTVTGEYTWTFYINSNITFPNNQFAVIERLDDVLEGSSTYTNYKVNNIRATMIKEMGSGGGLRALDFHDIYLVQPPEETTPYAPLVGTMGGGLIENCNIFNGIVVSDNEAGMLVGKATAGTVKDCSVSGDVIGRSTAFGYNGVFGVVDGKISVSGIKSTGLKFIEN